MFLIFERLMGKFNRYVNISHVIYVSKKFMGNWRRPLDLAVGPFPASAFSATSVAFAAGAVFDILKNVGKFSNENRFFNLIFCFNLSPKKFNLHKFHAQTIREKNSDEKEFDFVDFSSVWILLLFWFVIYGNIA
jgi:hypothetical protein